MIINKKMRETFKDVLIFSCPEFKLIQSGTEEIIMKLTKGRAGEYFKSVEGFIDSDTLNFGIENPKDFETLEELHSAIEDLLLVKDMLKGFEGFEESNGNQNYVFSVHLNAFVKPIYKGLNDAIQVIIEEKGSSLLAMAEKYLGEMTPWSYQDHPNLREALISFIYYYRPNSATDPDNPEWALWDLEDVMAYILGMAQIIEYKKDRSEKENN